MRVLFVLVATCLTYLSTNGVSALPMDRCSGLTGDACSNAGCFLGSYETCCGAQTQYCMEPGSVNCFDSSSIKCWSDGGKNPVQTWSSCLPSDFGIFGRFKPYTPPSSECPSDCKEGCEWVKDGGDGCQQTSCCPTYAKCKGSSSGGSTSGGSTSGSSSTSGGSTTTGSSTSGGSCSNVQCPNGFSCQVQGGNAVCVPNGGTTTGGGGDACSNVNCPDGFHCECDKWGGAKCVCDDKPPKPTHTPNDKFLCDNVHCPDGFQCKAKNGVAECVIGREKPRVCRGVDCPTGYRCEDHNRQPTCVLINRPNPGRCLGCDDVDCAASGLVCVMTRAQCKVGAVKCCEQQPVCIRPSTIAGSTIASIASTIGSISTTGTPGPVNTCNVVTCPTGTRCVFANNVATCIPNTV